MTINNLRIFAHSFCDAKLSHSCRYCSSMCRRPAAVSFSRRGTFATHLATRRDCDVTLAISAALPELICQRTLSSSFDNRRQSPDWTTCAVTSALIRSCLKSRQLQARYLILPLTNVTAKYYPFFLMVGGGIFLPLGRGYM